MEVLPLPVPPPLGVGDPRDPRDRRCLHARLRALLERQREEEERMFSRLRLDGPLGESTEKEVQTGLFTSMPLPKSHPLQPNDLKGHFILGGTAYHGPGLDEKAFW